MISSPLFAMIPPTDVSGELKEEIALEESVLIDLTKGVSGSPVEDTTVITDTVTTAVDRSRAISDTASISDSVTTTKGLDPTTLPVSVWLATSYTSPTWSGSVSTGVSGNLSFTSGAPPANGVALNGGVTADFNGTTHILNYPSSAGNSSLVPSLGLDGSWTFFVLYNADIIPSDSTTTVNNAALVQIEDATPTMSHSLFIASLRTTAASTFGISVKDIAGAVFKDVQVAAPAATGAWILGQAKYSHVAKTLTARTNSNSWSASVTSVPILYTNYNPIINVGYNVPLNLKFDGRIAEIIWVSTLLTDNQCNEIKSYLNNKYALSL